MFARWMLLFFFMLPGMLQAQEIGEKLQIPTLNDPVIDQGGMITAKDEQAIRSLIFDFHQRGKGQIQVLTLQNLAGLPIEQASIEIADKWKLGNDKRDDGVLILIAAKERRIRIEVGQGLEGVLTDIATKRIIEDVMVPVFRQSSPSQGILVGTFQVMRTIDPEFQATGQDAMAFEPRESGSPFSRFKGLFILLFILFVLFGNIFRPRRRTFLGGFGGWGGGGFGGGFGGGGFGGGGGGWGGGGGGFSGGGSSGSW